MILNIARIEPWGPAFLGSTKHLYHFTTLEKRIIIIIKLFAQGTYILDQPNLQTVLCGSRAVEHVSRAHLGTRTYPAHRNFSEWDEPRVSTSMKELTGSHVHQARYDI